MDTSRTAVYEREVIKMRRKPPYLPQEIVSEICRRLARKESHDDFSPPLWPDYPRGVMPVNKQFLHGATQAFFEILDLTENPILCLDGNTKTWVRNQRLLKRIADSEPRSRYVHEVRLSERGLYPAGAQLDLATDIGQLNLYRLACLLQKLPGLKILSICGDGLHAPGKFRGYTPTLERTIFWRSLLVQLPLSVRNLNLDGRVDLHQPIFHWAGTIFADPFFSGIKKLTVHQSYSDRSRAIIQLGYLASMPNLEDLHVRGPELPSMMGFSARFDPLPCTNRLRRLSLHNLSIRAADIHHILVSSQNTIEAVTLISTTTPITDAWTKIFKQLSRCPRLRTMCLRTPGCRGRGTGNAMQVSRANRDLVASYSNPLAFSRLMASQFEGMHALSDLIRARYAKQGHFACGQRVQLPWGDIFPDDDMIPNAQSMVEYAPLDAVLAGRAKLGSKTYPIGEFSTRTGCVNSAPPETPRIYPKMSCADAITLRRSTGWTHLWP